MGATELAAILPSGASAVPCFAELATKAVLEFLAFTTLGECLRRVLAFLCGSQVSSCWDFMLVSVQDRRKSRRSLTSGVNSLRGNSRV